MGKARSINDLIAERNLQLEEEISNDLRKMSRYERRRAFKQAGIKTQGKDSSLSQKRRKK